MVDSPDSIRNQLHENLARVRDQIEAACDRSGRNAESVQLVAVTKYTPHEVVSELVSLGHHILGENRPQQLIERAEQLSNDVNWHLIGQLQRNKVRSVLPHADLIHSVDSIKLLRRIDQIASELDLRPKVLLQVNVSGEDSKSGYSAETLKSQWEEITGFNQLKITGLMTMAPLTDDQTLIRNTFARLCELRDELNAHNEQLELTELSMGMSGDFEIAIEEGATLIRLGSALFAGCPSLK